MPIKSEDPARDRFNTTHWSIVLACSGENDANQAREALAKLFQTYWYPLYAYIRRHGHSAHDAQDLTQEFFCRLIEKQWLDDVDRDKGKLRSFLIVALKKFMSKEWRRASAQCRSGTHVQFDTVFAESRYAADSHLLAPEETFDQQWALTLLDLTIDRLRAEFAAANKAGDFDVLKHCLTAERGAIDYAKVGKEIGVAEGAARVAVHRLRKRFRQIYREEISHTLRDGSDLDAELRHLAAALAHQRG